MAYNYRFPTRTIVLQGVKNSTQWFREDNNANNFAWKTHLGNPRQRSDKAIIDTSVGLIIIRYDGNSKYSGRGQPGQASISQIH